MIYDAIDWQINNETPEIINSITIISLVKALEATARQHYNCICFHCQLHNLIFEKLVIRKDTYLIAPGTLQYKQKNLLFPFYNRRLKYGYEIDENMIY